MKSLVFFLLGILSFSSYGQRVIIIGLDGLSVEGYKTAKHPNLDELMNNGILSLTTRSVMPSVTLPNWTSHLTGSGPEQHGVVNNEWKIDTHTLPAIEVDNDGYYPSIFKVLKEQVPNVKTGYYYNWGNLINPINKEYLDDVSFLDEDRYIENYTKAVKFLKENRNNPTFVFLYSVHTDHAGHEHEWMSSEYILSIEEADIQIGRVINQLKEEDLFDDSHFILITDHGGLGSGHGGVSESEMLVPWGVSGPGIKKGEVLKMPNSNVNTSLLVSEIFNCRDNIPESWVGKLPTEVFIK